jgi:hypothetical protein
VADQHPGTERQIRPLPRPFTMHWGNGEIVEEASCSGEYHAPAIQLLEYRDGEAAGSYSVRFCFYSHDGRFQRSPLMLGEAEIDGLRAALASSPRLREILRRMVEDPPRD